MILSRLAFWFVAGLVGTTCGLLTAPLKASEPAAVYVADHADELIAHTLQGWGTLGLNTGIRPKGRTPTPLRVKDTRYARGLGMHANGEAIVDLAGAYRRFEAEVGVHYQSGGKGSVVCRIFVDDERRFDSGVLRQGDPPRTVRIPVEGAEELRLVVRDAGDGITCDAVDWGNARLIPDPSASALRDTTRVDIAPFGYVVTFDPERMEGTKAKRTEPMPAEDVFLATRLVPAPNGDYVVPVSAAGLGCIGLRWDEPRFLRDVSLTYAGSEPAKGPELQIWHGMSPWQGRWKPAKAEVERGEGRCTWRLQPVFGRDATQKVRWIFPEEAGNVVVTRLGARTTSRSRIAAIRIESHGCDQPGAIPIEVYNGDLLSPEASGDPHELRWDPRAPLSLKLRYCRTRRCKTDRTVLRFRTRRNPFSVSVEDVVAEGRIWIPHAGISVATDPPPTSLEDHLRDIADRQTVLDRVRAMPDQSFEQAMRKVHRPIQDRGPTMLSLACDNRKYVVGRDGTVSFYLYDRPDETISKPDYHLSRFPYQLRPTFGLDADAKVSRHMEGGWLPIPVATVTSDGVIYRQRTYVAPIGKDAGPGAPDWLRERAVCVMDYEIRNSTTDEQRAELTLRFASREKGKRITLAKSARAVTARVDDRLVALLDASKASALALVVKGAEVSLSGDLPAGKKVGIRVVLPAWRTDLKTLTELIDTTNLRKATLAYWPERLADSAQIELPNKLLSDVIRASQVHCLLAARNEERGLRIAPWTAADRYGPLESEGQAVVRGMDMMGHTDFARRSLAYYIHRYAPEGYVTTGYTLMGTGWHLWTLAEHVERTHGYDWLATVGNDVARACRWISRQRRKTKRIDATGRKVPEYGLVPAGVFADWPRFTYTTFQAAQYCAGLREAAKVLKRAAHPDADSLVRDAEAYREDIRRAYGWTQARTPAVRLQDGTWVPGYPPLIYCFGEVGGFFPGEDGSRAWCKNAMAHQLAANGVLDPRSKGVGRMLEHMEDVEFLRGGLGEYPAEEVQADFFNLGGFNKCQPYYRRNVELYALRDDVKPFIRSYFNTPPSLLNTENLSFWEHFHNQGAWNKTHETGWFLCQTRLMLVMERGDALWLAPFVTTHWLEDGLRVSARKMPTRFGPVSYQIRSSAEDGYIEATIEPPTRSMPKEVVIRLRHPDGRALRSAVVNGTPCDAIDAEQSTIRLPAGRETIRIRAKYGA